MELDWKNLGFGYMPTDYNVRCYYRNGKWGELEVHSSQKIDIHIAATCLHYGQESFEGMKAYMGKDGQIRIFRWKDNAARMRSSAKGIKLAEVPDEIFHSAIVKAISLNKQFVPPHGTGASLYIRPLLLGTGPEIGVKPSKEYVFMVFVMPVGPYFKEGFKPVDMMVCRDFDRAAPLGTGNIKVGGNYAASMLSIEVAHNKGFATALYLDAREKKYIDEAGPANFFGIKNNTYITPDSPSVLPSITNKCLQELAKDMGLKVERRKIPIEELEELEEAGACGTAAIISPIGKIADPASNKIYTISKDGKPGKVSEQLYKRLIAIQYGDEVDKFGWTEIVS
ncbi:MAG: branched-chain amino acid aminotransferase [Bacteroidales bacterium]|nr:branched-chain amino acid aminotransferase [Bacteroidales bacterium]MCF8391313.1 branched-chain amino acid aminotransferase [Bacteroidales bacterium]